MKKTKFLVFPLLAILITSCSVTISGSDMPEFVKNPLDLLNLNLYTKVSGDEEMATLIGRLIFEKKASYDFYSNFIKETGSLKSKDENSDMKRYVMHQDDVTYLISDGDSVKEYFSYREDGLENFNIMITTYEGYGQNGYHMGESIHWLMSKVGENGDGGDEDDSTKLTRTGNTYTLTYTFSYPDINTVYSATDKITFKNNYYSGYETTKVYKRDNKTVTVEESATFTYGTRKAYPKAKMPNLNDYEEFFFGPE